MTTLAAIETKINPEEVVGRRCVLSTFSGVYYYHERHLAVYFSETLEYDCVDSFSMRRKRNSHSKPQSGTISNLQSLFESLDFGVFSKSAPDKNLQ